MILVEEYSSGKTEKKKKRIKKRNQFSYSNLEYEEDGISTSRRNELTEIML